MSPPLYWMRYEAWMDSIWVPSMLSDCRRACNWGTNREFEIASIVKAHAYFITPKSTVCSGSTGLSQWGSKPSKIKWDWHMIKESNAHTLKSEKRIDKFLQLWICYIWPNFLTQSLHLSLSLQPIGHRSILNTCQGLRLLKIPPGEAVTKLGKDLLASAFTLPWGRCLIQV